MKEIQRDLGFTLIEILVVITIISILVLGSLQIDLSRLTQKQEIGLELIQVMNILEEVRNNALIGRGVGADLETPDSWKIEISANNGGLVESFTTVGPTDTPYSNGSWVSKKNREILELECRNFDGSIVSALSGVVSLTLIGSTIDMNATGCDTQTQKILFIRYGNENLSETLTINTLSGVIQRN